MKNIDLKKYRFGLSLLCIFTISSLILDIILPYVNGRFIDDLVLYKNFWQIAKLIGIIFILGFFNSIIKYSIKYKGKELIEYIIFDFKKKILNHLRQISIIKYKKYDSTYLNKRIEQDTTQVVSFFIENYIIFFTKTIQMFVVVFILFKINKDIALTVMITCPLYFFIYKQFRKSIFKDSLVSRENAAKFFQIFNNQLEYMEDIVLESNYNIQDNILKNKFSTYFESSMNYTKTTSKFNFAQSMFSLFFQMIIFLFGGYYVIKNEMTIGELTMVITYFSTIMGIIAYYIEFAKSYQITKSSLSRITELLEIETISEGKVKITEISKIETKLSFSYDGIREIFSDININANKGDIVGIIGTNGSGKTTVSKLMVGAIKNNLEEMGIVFNDKYNISRLDTIFLRNKNISYIPQKIRYVNISICDIFNELGCFHKYTDVIEELSNKNIVLTEEIKSFLDNCWNKKIDELSGGDKQLIVILKNLIKDADLIIFDEPSSNLDKERILWLRKTINDIKSNKIIIIITHDDYMFDILDKKININRVCEVS